MMNLAIALRDYGGYIVDTGTPMDMNGWMDCWAFIGEYEDPDIEAVREDWETMGKLASLMRIVVNNGPDNVGGGGRPRTCFAPPLD